jgi:hypothetical protein
VRRVDAHHQSLFALFGEIDAGGRRHAGFAYAAFATEEKNPHNL